MHGAPPYIPSGSPLGWLAVGKEHMCLSHHLPIHRGTALPKSTVAPAKLRQGLPRPGQVLRQGVTPSAWQRFPPWLPSHRTPGSRRCQHVRWLCQAMAEPRAEWPCRWRPCGCRTSPGDQHTTAPCQPHTGTALGGAAGWGNQCACGTYGSVGMCGVCVCGLGVSVGVCHVSVSPCGEQAHGSPN